IEDPAALTERWCGTETRIVAANGGTGHVLAAGLTPHHVIGDLDSLSDEIRERLSKAGTEFHHYPPAKDETDLELALLWAAEQGADEIVVLGVLGGRPDQELANLLLLALPELEGLTTLMVRGCWEIRLIRGKKKLHLEGTPGQRLSLIPLGGDARGVTTAGLRFPLHSETLRFGPARGVSNVFEGNEVTIELEAGLLWCFHERRMHERWE
ncbi:MAG: thiamine diphosphokinase, partial [Anaerolineae bacterium]